MNQRRSIEKKLKTDIDSIQKSLENVIKTTSTVTVNCKNLNEFDKLLAGQLKEVSLVQNDLAQQILILTDAITDIREVLGLNSKQRKFFTHEDPWN